MPELALKKQVLGLRTASFWLCPLKSGTALGCKQLYDMLAREEHVIYFFFLSLKFLFKLVPVNIIKTKQNKTTKKTYRIWDLAVLFHWHCLVPTCVASPPQTYCDGRFLPLLSKKKKSVTSSLCITWVSQADISSSILPKVFPSSPVSGRPCLSTISFYQSPERLMVNFIFYTHHINLFSFYVSINLNSSNLVFCCCCCFRYQ